MRLKRILLRLAMVSALCLTLLRVPCAMGEFSFTANPLIGKQAPDFTLKTLDGKETSLTEFRSGGPAIIFFWATWCPHCRHELKTLNQSQAGFERQGIRVLLVNLEESPRMIKSFTDKYKVPFTVFLDEKSSVADQYSIIGVPTLIFVDKDGVVKSIRHDLPDDYAEVFKTGEGKKS